MGEWVMANWPCINGAIGLLNSVAAVNDGGSRWSYKRRWMCVAFAVYEEKCKTGWLCWSGDSGHLFEWTVDTQPTHIAWDWMVVVCKKRCVSYVTVHRPIHLTNVHLMGECITASCVRCLLARKFHWLLHPIHSSLRHLVFLIDSDLMLVIYLT